MLTASVLWGIFLTTGLFRRRKVALLDMHRWLSGLTLFFIAGHLTTLVFDKYAHIGARAILIPFAGSWRPTAVALGSIALYLFIAVALTSMARKKLAKKWWRDVHIFSYVMFWSVTIHGALAGTDATTLLYRVAGIVVLAAVVSAISLRALSHHVQKRPAANAAAGRLPASTRTPSQTRSAGAQAR